MGDLVREKSGRKRRRWEERPKHGRSGQKREKWERKEKMAHFKWEENPKHGVGTSGQVGALCHVVPRSIKVFINFLRAFLCINTLH